MPVDPVELADEQKYFDAAWDAREASRELLSRAHENAGVNVKDQAAIRREAKQRAAALGTAEVAFGRFDAGDEALYVGKDLITNDDRDVLVINWQSRAATPYYQATVADPLGVDRIRKFKTEENEVLSFEDTVFTDIAARINELSGSDERHHAGVDDALLADLDRGRDGSMRDIVQTIHHSQDAIIRAPLDRLLVVQGGPGTGKTAVALHRVSVLLFEHRGTMSPADILVLGPSKAFTKYISQVLPSLGDEGVSTADFSTLGPQGIKPTRTERIDLARLKGQERMAGLLRTALYNRIRFPKGEQTVSLGPLAALRFTREEVETVLARLRSLPTYSAGRSGLRNWLMDEGTRRAPRDVRVSTQTVDNIAERIWPQLSPARFVQELLGSRQQLLDAAGDEFSAKETSDLYRQAAEKLAAEAWTKADIGLLDEADTLINGRPRTYAHIVVDEAQDLSPLQLRSLSRRSARGSFTVVGDIAQSTGPWARDTWGDVVTILHSDCEVSIEELEYGYRVPRQIFEFAAQLLPHAAERVTPPQVVRDGAHPQILQTSEEDMASEAVAMARAHASNGLFVGIIAPHGFLEDVADALSVAGVSYDDASVGQLGKTINLLSPDEAKGLEFEAAIVLEPAEIAAASVTGYRKLYVALTRTTKELTVVHSQAFAALGLAGTREETPLKPTSDTLRAPVPSGTTLIQATSTSTMPDAASSPTPEQRAPSPRPKTRPRRSAATLLAEDIADEVKSQLTPETWADFLDALIDQLSATE